MEIKKFIVIRESDIEKYSDYRKPLLQILVDINDGREKDCKKTNDKFYVVNTLEPYSQLVWDLISAWEKIREREKSIGEHYIPSENIKKKTKDDNLGLNDFDIFKV